MGSGGRELEILVMANLTAAEARVILAFPSHNAVFGSAAPNHCYRELFSMPADQGPVVQSALLCRDLARLRREKELTYPQVAGALGWPSSKLIKIEGGHGTITTADLDALLAQYGITAAG